MSLATRNVNKDRNPFSLMSAWSPRAQRERSGSSAHEGQTHRVLDGCRAGRCSVGKDNGVFRCNRAAVASDYDLVRRIPVLHSVAATAVRQVSVPPRQHPPRQRAREARTASRSRFL